MTDQSFPETLSPARHIPPLLIQGEFSIRQLVEQWREEQSFTPKLLISLPDSRYEHQLTWELKYCVPSESAVVTTPCETESQLEIPIPLEMPEFPLMLTAPVERSIDTTGSLQISSYLAVDSALSAEPVEPAKPPNKLWSWKPPSVAWPTLSLAQLDVHWLRLAGNFALSSAFALGILFGGPILILETRPLLAQALSTLNLQSKSNADTEPVSLPTPDAHITSAEDAFSIQVPSLGITSTIVANVDATNETEYTKALKTGIAHAKGTALPDQTEENKTIYLFAHSTDAPWNILRYNAQFYALKDAEIGSELTVRFWGKDYHYIIQEKQIIEAHDVSLMQPQTEREQLVLQTCYPPGTAEKRLVIIATPVVQGETDSAEQERNMKDSTDHAAVLTYDFRTKESMKSDL